MTTIDETRPVRLARRSRQGIVLGLDGYQLTFLVIAAGVVLLAVNVFGMGGLASLLLALPIAAAAVWNPMGISTPRVAGLWLSKQVRHATGGTKQLYRPERVQKEGTVNLPGWRASVQLWDVDGLGVTYNPFERTVSFTAELEVEGFLMKDVSERHTLAHHWSQVLASLTQRSGIKRVTVQERTTPATIRAARDHFQATRAQVRTRLPEAVTGNYEEVMDVSERYAVRHSNYLTVTLDLASLDKQVRALGGGQKGACAVAGVEAGNIADALRNARVQVRRWLSTRDIAALARTTFDPGFIANVQNRPVENTGVDVSAIGPMYLEEPRGKNGIVYTDSGVHTTMWIHEWPRSAAAVGFVSPVVFARHPVTGETVTHIFTIVLTPVPVQKALKRIRTEKKAWRSNERLRAKRGGDGSAADDADWHALEQQEEELVAGHGEFRYAGYLTITGKDEAELEQAVAGARNALARAGMEAQVLYCQQAEALLVNALPLGLGMK